MGHHLAVLFLLLKQFAMQKYGSLKAKCKCTVQQIINVVHCPANEETGYTYKDHASCLNTLTTTLFMGGELHQFEYTLQTLTTFFCVRRSHRTHYPCYPQIANYYNGTA